jgi:hypothetical protein
MLLPRTSSLLLSPLCLSQACGSNLGGRRVVVAHQKGFGASSKRTKKTASQQAEAL